MDDNALCGWFYQHSCITRFNTCCCLVYYFNYLNNQHMMIFRCRLIDIELCKSSFLLLVIQGRPEGGWGAGFWGGCESGSKGAVGGLWEGGGGGCERGQWGSSFFSKSLSSPPYCLERKENSTFLWSALSGAAGAGICFNCLSQECFNLKHLNLMHNLSLYLQ